MEQFRLPLEPTENTTEQGTNLEKLTLEELQTLYQRVVGINPKPRAFDIPTLIAGIQNPQAEKNRISQIDRESDQDDILRTYRT
jgi:hypothetical protein